jgi:hypothetical protein
VSAVTDNTICVDLMHDDAAYIGKLLLTPPTKFCQKAAATALRGLGLAGPIEYDRVPSPRARGAPGRTRLRSTRELAMSAVVTRKLSPRKQALAGLRAMLMRNGGAPSMIAALTEQIESPCPVSQRRLYLAEIKHRQAGVNSPAVAPKSRRCKSQSAD